METLAVFVAGTVTAAALPMCLLLSARAPMQPGRVARFARRQHLTITPGNGNQVVCYLAITRRWRVAALIAAYLLWLGYLLLDTADGRVLRLDLLYLLAAWFVGAVIAEARLARRPAGVRRRASLLPRQPAAYLSRSARLAMPAALLCSVLVAVLTLAAALTGREFEPRPAGFGFGSAVIVTALVWAVRREVLGRPQPADLPADQLAADDAIRSRSLHVLAGAGTALVLYAVGYQLQAFADYPPGSAAALLVVAAVPLPLVAPLLGWAVATASWAVRRPTAQPT